MVTRYSIILSLTFLLSSNVCAQQQAVHPALRQERFNGIGDFYRGKGFAFLRTYVAPTAAVLLSIHAFSCYRTYMNRFRRIKEERENFRLRNDHQRVNQLTRHIDDIENLLNKRTMITYYCAGLSICEGLNIGTSGFLLFINTVRRLVGDHALQAGPFFANHGYGFLHLAVPTTAGMLIAWLALLDQLTVEGLVTAQQENFI